MGVCEVIDGSGRGDMLLFNGDELGFIGEGFCVESGLSSSSNNLRFLGFLWEVSSYENKEIIYNEKIMRKKRSYC